MNTPDMGNRTVNHWLRGVDIATVKSGVLEGLKKVGFSFVSAAKAFKDDSCMLRASALTYYTLLSIVPVMAMAFGIAKGFGFEKLLEKELLSRFAGQEEAVLKIMDFSEKILSETKGGLMAALGVIFLFWSVAKMLNHIENAFNAIWWIKKGRSLSRKFSDYLALLFTAPLFLIFSGSITVFISTRLTRLLSSFEAHFILETSLSFCLKFLPFCVMGLLFTFLYLFIPNKKVSMKAAFTGGVIAGTVYQAAQVIYINFQVGVSQFNAIYGSFAALPLFLIWLQASWLILLVGAEIAFVWENMDAIKQNEQQYDEISIQSKKLLCLRMVQLCSQRFAKAEPPASDTEIAAELDIPLRVVRQLLPELTQCLILSEVNSDSGPRFQPARDIESLSILTVIQAIENFGEEASAVSGTLEFEALNEAFESFESAARQSPGERLLKDI